MKKITVNFCSYLIALVAVFIGAVGYAAQAPNPRASSGTSGTTTETGATVSPRGGTGTSDAQTIRSTSTETSGRTATVSRGSTSRASATVSRASSGQPATVVSGRSATTRQTVQNNAAVTRSATTARAASSNVARSATATTARAGAVTSVVGSSARSSTARATAVFTDIEKIGGGYAKCREAYATCMDQFCANANDTYRRCICSERYNEFRNTEAALEEAMDLLVKFQDNNLTAVGMSAAEVAAMYSATEGEKAIRDDTSAAGKMLVEIDDLLSGKKSASGGNSDSLSLGILSIDFTSDIGDIWGEGGSSIFDTSTGVDLSTLVGEELYSAASRQCAKLVEESCENDAVMTMARSAYGIMVTQDCNIYERSINSQRENVEQAVRTAEKYLRQARLEDYQTHNSADVNECVANVRTAMLTDAACGANFNRCLDPTGAYVNPSTGEAILSPRLFQLTSLIVLPGITGSIAQSVSYDTDVLKANREFDDFLDDKRIYAETALDSCRDISKTVWEEFKRQAIIEIAQAQDEKVEEVRMNCVSVIAECYDTQTDALRDIDTTTSQYSGAISAAAARSMCENQVIACASLYGDNENCSFDNDGRLVARGDPRTEGGSLTGAAASERCGLTELLAFVDTVDTVRINEGCETAIRNYVNSLCTPSTGDLGYPWNCSNLSKEALKDNLTAFAERTCRVAGEYLTTDAENIINGIIEEVQTTLLGGLAERCEDLGGYWIFENDETYGFAGSDALPFTDFYSTVFGVRLTNFDQAVTSARTNRTVNVSGGSMLVNEDAPYGLSYGQCAEDTIRVRCQSYNDLYGEDVATYDATRNICDLSEQWYINQCESQLDGYYENGKCYALNPNKVDNGIRVVKPYIYSGVTTVQSTTPVVVKPYEDSGLNSNTTQN